MTSHTAKVARIVEQLQAHRGPLSHTKIDIGELTEILSIDPVRRIYVAESGVTFVELVPELSTIGVSP
jgi:hypothetical protein